MPIGIDNFSNIINDEFYYVYKTKAIEELLDSRGGVKSFPRPRKFGKTLFMSTLENFFDIDKKDVNKDLFKVLYINNTKYKDVQNTYSVINMSLKSLKQRTFKDVIEQYKILIASIYDKKRYVLECLEKEKKYTIKFYLKQVIWVNLKIQYYF